MNSIQKGLLTLMTAGVAAGAFVGCDEDDTFDINSPDWLESRVDSIAQSKANNATGDTVKVELSNTTVGDKDNSAGWWTVFSDIIGIPSGKKLTLEFDNYGSGADNWNNWNICVVNAKATSTEANENYKEYFVLRSDAYGWGGGMADEGYAYEAANISTNYADVAAAAGVDDQWALFKEKMQGAHTVMEIQHVAAGYVYLTSTPSWPATAAISRTSRPSSLRPPSSSPRATLRAWSSATTRSSSLSATRPSMPASPPRYTLRTALRPTPTPSTSPSWLPTSPPPASRP